MLNLKSNGVKFNNFYFNFYWGFFSAGYFAYKKLIDVILPFRRWIVLGDL